MSDLFVSWDGDVLILTLNRPDRLNAISNDMREGLISALGDELAEQKARAVLITGAGRGFCSGADLDPETIFARIPKIEHQIKTGMNEVIRLIRELPVPVIAAVNGAAAGAGFSLALAADIVLAAKSAKFAATFVRIGAVLDAGASYMLTQKIGAGRAAALAMLGDAIDADTARDWGIVWKVYEEDNFSDEALVMAKRLAAGPTKALALLKQEIATAQSSTLAETMNFEAKSQAKAFASDDFREGVTAFSNRRKPNFKGR